MFVSLQPHSPSPSKKLIRCFSSNEPNYRGSVRFGKTLTKDTIEGLRQTCLDKQLSPADIVNTARERQLTLGEGHEARVLRSPDIPEICIRIPHESQRQQRAPLSPRSIITFRPPSALIKPNGEPLFIEPFADITDPQTGATFQLLPRVPGTAIARSFTDRGATHYLGGLFHQALERGRQKTPDLTPEALAEAVCLKPGEPYRWGKIPSTPQIELGHYHQFLRFQHAYPRMMRALARLPQATYTNAIDTIQRCQNLRVTLDCFHGNNTMDTGKELVFIDPMKTGQHPLHDACSTPMGLFYALTENYEPPVAARTPGHLAKQLIDPAARAKTQEHLETIRHKIYDGIRDVYGRQAEADERAAYAEHVFYGRTPSGGRQRLKGAARRTFPKGGLQPLPFHRQLHFFAGRTLGKGWLWGRGNKQGKTTA